MKIEYPFRRHAAIAVGFSLSLLAATESPAVTVKVGPSADEPGSACQTNSLQAAVDSLPPGSEQHTIELEESVYLGNNATLDINGLNVVVATKYQAGTQCRVQAPEGSRAELNASQTTLPGGRTVAVYNHGTLVLESVAVTENQRGGILVLDSGLVIRDAVISGHSTVAGPSSGAGVLIGGGFLTIENSLFSGNVARANGGAVFCTTGVDGSESNVSIRSGSRFEGNAAVLGGAIYQFRGCTLEIGGRSLLAGNSAELDGGAIGTDPGDRNLLVLDDVEFVGNIAGRDGGAVSISSVNLLNSASDSVAIFSSNLAGRFGGAIDVGPGGETFSYFNGAARFTLNTAVQRGGAISVRGGFLVLRGTCARGNTVDENYCAMFDANEVFDNPVLPRSGGTFDLHGGSLIVDGFAFRNSKGPSSATTASGGVIGFVDSGNLNVVNSLVFDTPAVDTTSQRHLFKLNGGDSVFSFNSMVDLSQGAVVLVQPGATAALIGNIIAGNSAGITGEGEVSGTCNNMQIGDGEVPLDPRFTTTAGGRYRLAADSPMIGRGLTCESEKFPPFFSLPARDLDGNRRIRPQELEAEVDLGAFEFQEAVISDRVFANGFEDIALRD